MRRYLLDTSLALGFLMLGFSCTLQSAAGQSTPVTVTVPGTADPWLAGMPNGSTASCEQGRCDFAPAESPAPKDGIAVTPGAVLTITAKGLVSGGSPLQSDGFGPDGDQTRPAYTHDAHAENGIGDISALNVALVGVFLGPNQPDSMKAPDPATSNQKPELQQVFLIGSRQTVTVPAGATRLFLGVKDTWGWFDNLGTFEVTVAMNGCQVKAVQPFYQFADPWKCDIYDHPHPWEKASK